MEQAQSIVMMLALVALAFSPLVYRWAKRRDAAERAPLPHEGLAPIMSGREAAARHLFGEAHDWDWKAMADFDALPEVREPWLTEADLRLSLLPPVREIV